MWNDLLTQIAPTLMTIAGAILLALGGIITKFVSAHFGASTAMVVSTGYQMATDAAAGWLKTYLDSLTPAGVQPTPAPPLTPNSAAVQHAVEYMKASFPDAIAKVEADGPELGNAELAADILGAFGKLAPGPIGAVAGIVAGVIKSKKS